MSDKAKASSVVKASSAPGKDNAGRGASTSLPSIQVTPPPEKRVDSHDVAAPLPRIKTKTPLTDLLTALSREVNTLLVMRLPLWQRLMGFAAKARWS
jgi:hypothetical protein